MPHVVPSDLPENLLQRSQHNAHNPCSATRQALLQQYIHNKNMVYFSIRSSSQKWHIQYIRDTAVHHALLLLLPLEDSSASDTELHTSRVSKALDSLDRVCLLIC